MSPVAEILYALGYTITGSDVNESDNVSRLRGLGIPIFMGHDAAHVDGADLVVYTAAVNRKNPELLAAENQNIPLVEPGEDTGDDHPTVSQYGGGLPARTAKPQRPPCLRRFVWRPNWIQRCLSAAGFRQ